MTIYFATDHAGFELKNVLIEYVQNELGYDVEDCGATEMNPDDDYPVFVQKAAKAVSEFPLDRRAIILGGSGQGEAISANRFSGVRAALYYGGDKNILTLSRKHNNANVLSLGARFIDEEQAKDAVRLWLGTEFIEKERHTRRINLIDNK